MENRENKLENDLLRDVVLLDRLKKEEDRNYNRIIEDIRRRGNRTLFWRVSLSVAAVGLVAFVLGNLFKAPESQVLHVADVYQKVEAPMLITDSGEQIALKDNNSYTLEYVEPAKARENAKVENYENIDKEEIQSVEAQKIANNAAVSRNTVIIPNGYTYNIKFDDGTEAHINSGSYIEYPKSFSNRNKRVVSLTGEGYFKVAKSDKPFIVKAAGLEIKVYGTEFNLNTNKENRVEVLLVSGSVGVTSESSNEEIMLNPNEMFSYNLHSGEILKQVVDPTDYLGWMNGDFTCSNSSLFDLLDEICAFYGITVNRDEALVNQLITISLSRKLGYRQIMEIMESAFGLKFTQEDKMQFRCSNN